MPRDQLMVPDRLPRLGLQFRETGLLDSSCTVLAKQLAGFGQNQAASDSLKQAKAKGVFSGIELFANTAGGEPKLFRRIVDIVFGGNCQKTR